MEPSSSRASAILRLLFEYEGQSAADLAEACADLPPKLIRWLAVNHPDNRTRLVFYRYTNVPIGDDTVINSHVILYDAYAGLVSFGKRVAVASGATMVAVSGANNSRLTEIAYVRDHLIRTAPVVIQDDVWIGANAVILPGVTVGEGAVIGAGAVVTADVPPYSVVAGAPGRVVRSLERGRVPGAGPPR